MKQLPKISIIMNCYNSDSFLKEAIDSVYEQTFTDWEIIFWDNVSTDDSAVIAKSFNEKLRYYLAEKNTNLGEARNLALQKARGKYICFLDCDDLFLKNKLSMQYRIMENNAYAMCYGSTAIINSEGKISRKEQVRCTSGQVFKHLLDRYEIKMVSVMIRHSVLKDNNLWFASHLKFCPDHNLFMEIASRYNVGVISQFIAQYRVQVNSLSRQTLDLASVEIKYTLDKILKRDESINIKYPCEVKSAYSKLSYYDAIYYIYQNDYAKASNKILKIYSNKWQYKIIYVLLLLRIPKNLLLRILKR